MILGEILIKLSTYGVQKALESRFLSNDLLNGLLHVPYLEKKYR